MSVYRKVAVLSDTDAAYIAGLVDGEGTITLTRRDRQDTRQLVVSIANTEADLLEFVLKAVAAGKITHKKTTARQHTPSFVYSIERQALSLLSQICVFLRSHKRVRAELVLARDAEVVPRNGKCTQVQRALRTEFEKQFFAITSRLSASAMKAQMTPPTRVGGV